ncbi:MAG: threonylcarbamoyl-AMP synthase [Nitrospira sp.]|nr:threonylcarbamoyl-AMP synthase [Nitrospira sp.]MBH0184767.1 threonylcarbamoyl-AMP synthase [Nitrospira sp.]
MHRLSDQVRQVVARGGIVAVPTETYYGLGVNPFDPQAVDRLVRLKGRPDGKPILVLIGNRGQLTMLVQKVSRPAALLMDTFWPGPLTILFTAAPSLPSNLTAGTGTVGVRLSSCGPLAELLAVTGPLTGTSANYAGESPAQYASQVQDRLGHDLSLIVDAGPTPGGPPSTVIDAREAVCVIREGAVTRQMLQDVLQTDGMSLA